MPVALETGQVQYFQWRQPTNFGEVYSASTGFITKLNGTGNSTAMEFSLLFNEGENITLASNHDLYV